MKELAHYIVNHKRLIIISYIILVILSLVGTRFTTIEYDLSSYLPTNMNSIRGRDILKDEFGINGNASLLLRDKTFYEVLDIKEKIKALPEVKSVIWLDDVEDIRKPQEYFNEKLSSRFIKDGYSLLQVQFNEGNDSLSTRDALVKIDEISGGEHYISGPAAVSMDMRDTVSREIVYYSIAAFIIITIILLFSSSSYFEPILFFIPIGVAMAINMGTNFIFGRVASNTHSVASIIQLAVSMDYSIFLIHRYREELEKRESAEAMVHAIMSTFSSISASSLTTVCGFLALIVMNYGMGKDMGLVLAKGVLLSLVTVVTLLPCLVLISEKLFKNHKHRILMPSFKRVSKWLVRLRYAALILAIVIAVPAFLGQGRLNYYYSTEKTLSDSSKAVNANNKIKEVFGSNNEMVLIVPKSDKIKIKRLVNDIETIDRVGSVQGLYSMVDYSIRDTFIPGNIKDTFESERFTFFNIRIDADTEGAETGRTIKKIREASSNYFDEWYLTGEAAVYLDLQEVTSKDFNNVTILSILLVGLILILTFKSILIPIILVFVIQLGIWINLSLPYFQGIELNFMSFIIIGAIQLGATVDYGILFTSRYKENLLNYSQLEAVKKTIEDTGRSVLTSALILMAGTFSVSFITTIKSGSELTLLIGRGAIISLILVYTLLPALLLIFDRLIKYTTIGWPKNIKR